MTEFYTFKTADHILSGKHSLEKLKDNMNLIEGKPEKALILGSASIKRLGYIDKIVNQLADLNVDFDINLEILPEPTEQNIYDVYRSISDKHYDLYIGIGGGSILDATKILSILKTNDRPIRDMLGTELVEKPGIPTVLIPTTSGTGAEVTPNAIVTFPEDELKIGIVSKYLLPEVVIIDPTLTAELPKSVTASTGMDAFTHSLESFISNKANPISDMFALESIRLISSSIVESYQNGTSIEAREKMLIGSMYGGMALTSAGTAAVHALAYPLGGKFNIPHGVANSMLLPHVMEFNKDSISDRLSQVAEAMGIEMKDNIGTSTADKVISQIRNWTHLLNIPQDLKVFGVKEEDLTELANAASNVTRLLNNNPKPLSIQDIKNIYSKIC